MKASGVAFQDKDKQESLPSVPHYRDIQVSITDRRRLLQPGYTTRIKNEKIRKQQKETQRDLDESDATEDEAIHKRRNKQRRKFLKAKHQADMALEGDETKHEDESDDSDDETSQSNSSFSASSTTKSSFYNDDDSFGLSLSSLNSTLFNESQETNRNTDHTQSSDWDAVVTSSGQSGSESDVSSITGGSKNNEDKNLDIHIHVLDRLQKPKNKWKNEVSDFGTPQLKTVFAIFCLGVMLNEDNWITLSDLLYWADCGSISYKTSLLCIPQDMKLNGRVDIHTFKAIGDRPPNSSRLREDIYKVGTYLNLDNVRFAEKHMVGTLRYSTQILEIIARFTRELSLPQSIVSSIRKKLNILVTEGFKCHFQRWEAFKRKERQRKIKNQVFEVPSLDIYCMAIIIFVLKFDFGLDDRTEIGLSSLAMTKNEHTELPSAANVSKKYFVFSEWLALSKRRVFLAAKFCHHLHNRYTNSLLPEVERSTPSKARFIEEVADRAQEIKFHSDGLGYDQENRKNSDDPYSDYGTSTASEYSYANNGEESSKIVSDLLKTSEFIRKEFPSGFGKRKHEQTEDLKGTTGVKRNTLDISTSDTPLHDFSIKQIEFNRCDRHGEDKIRGDDSKKIESLLDMYNTQVLCAIDLPFHAPKDDTIISNSSDVKDFLLAPLLHPEEVKKRSVSSESNNYLTKSILSSTESRLPNTNVKSETDYEQLFLGRKYWISQYYAHNPVRNTYDNWQTLIDKDHHPRAIAKAILRYIHKLLFLFRNKLRTVTMIFLMGEGQMGITMLEVLLCIIT